MASLNQVRFVKSAIPRNAVLDFTGCRAVMISTQYVYSVPTNKAGLTILLLEG